MNKAKYALEIFNLRSGNSVRKIPFEKEGPNGVGVTNGFRIITKDCVLVASIPPKIQILDFNGIKKNSIPVIDKSNPVTYLSSNNEIPFLLGADFLYGAQPFFRDILRTTPSDLKNSTHIFKVNLNDGAAEAEWLKVFRPPHEWEEGKKSVDFTWADRYDSIIISPRADHRLWVISKKTSSLLEYKVAKSVNVNKFRIIEGFPVGDEGIIESLASDRYELFLFDQYRDVFYRFFFVGIDWETYNLSPRELFSNPPKVGILVLDKDLAIIGEHVFDNHVIETWNYFVGKQGLYVSTNNPNRADFDENVLRYDVIRFSGLTYED